MPSRLALSALAGLCVLLSSCASVSSAKHCPVARIQFVGTATTPDRYTPTGKYRAFNDGSSLLRIPLGSERPVMLHPAHGELQTQTAGGEWQERSPEFEDFAVATQTLDIAPGQSGTFLFDEGLFQYAQAIKGQEYRLVVSDQARRCKFESAPFIPNP